MTDTQDKVLSTGYTELDNLLDGGLTNNGCLITLTAGIDHYPVNRFALHIAENFLRNPDHDKSVLFFLLNHGRENAEDLQKCLHLDSTKLNRLEIIDWNPDEREMIDMVKKFKYLSNLGLVIIDDIDNCKSSIVDFYKDNCDMTKRSCKFEKDFLTMVTLKQITSKLNIPVLAVKQPMNPDSFRAVSRFTDIILDISYANPGVHISATKIKNTEFILKAD